jgi:hypothetical protein
MDCIALWAFFVKKIEKTADFLEKEGHFLEISGLL